ncbi:hypothetical protein HMPREF1444_00861, partial [Helicobacter pylori HP250BFii]
KSGFAFNFWGVLFYCRTHFLKRVAIILLPTKLNPLIECF